MKRLISVIAPAALLLSMWCLPAMAQDTQESTNAETAPAVESGVVDLLTGADSVSEARLATYIHDQSGNQSWARQYDGRTFNPLGIELFDSYGYDRQFQYWLGGRDLTIGDEEIFLQTMTRNALGFRFFTDALVHRLVTQLDVDPFTFAELTRLRAADPTIPQLSLGRDWDSHINLSPDAGPFSIDRRVTGADLHGKIGQNQRARLVGGWWQEHEVGDRQFLFRSRQNNPLLASGLKGAVEEPVDRTLNMGSFGTDVSIGNSAINYRLVLSRFDDNRNWPAAGSALDFLPLNSLTKINTTTTSNVVKARSNITNRLSFTGAFINKTRQNDSNDVPTGFVNAGQPLSKRVKLNSTNAALVFRATDALTITGRYRQLDLDNESPAIFTAANPATPANLRLSENTKAFEFEGDYTGLPRTFLRLGYERRDTDRDTGIPNDFPPPFTSDETNWNIVRVKGRWYPSLRFNLSAGFENWSADNAGYQGTPDERTRIDVNGTYMVTDNLAFYGNYNKSDESNGQIRVADVPTAPPATADYREERELAAGQNLENNVTTLSFGTWYAVNSKLSFDANYSHFAVDSQALWVLGDDPNYLPHLQPDLVPYQGRSDQWSIGTTYAIAPRWRLRGNFLMATSFAAAFVDPTIYLGLGPAWTPFDGHYRQWTAGFSHDLGERDRIDVDFSQTNWSDEVDASQTGRFGVWRFAYSRAF